MSDDRDIARKAVDYQTRARDYPLISVPGYMAWSERKVAEGESEALIAHLDATSMCLLPEELASITESDFEDLLEDLRQSLEK